MRKAIPFFIVAIIFAVLGFSFAKFCPIGIKFGPAQAHASSMAPGEGDPRFSSLVMTARSVIEGYKRDHNNAYPEFAKYGWKQLTYRTNSKGQISEQSNQLSGNLYGPYFQSAPTNPLTKTSEVLVVRSIPDDFKSSGSYGFVFAEDTGKFFALTPDGKIFDDAAAPR